MKKKIVVWGVNKECLKIIGKIYCNYNVIAIGGEVDGHSRLLKTIIKFLQILKICKNKNEVAYVLKNKDVDYVLVLSKGDAQSNAIRWLIEDAECKKIFVIPTWALRNGMVQEEYFAEVDTSRPRLRYFEYHISNHCNLNCKGCIHFCPLVTEPSYGDIVQFKNDLKRLHELVWGVGVIRLMGGEPLLNPNANLFVEAAREEFKDADIRVVTNGTILKEEHCLELLNSMKRCNAGFDVSLYPVISDKVKSIKRICRKYNINLRFTKCMDTFYAQISLCTKSNISESFSKCEMKKCTFLKDGKISVCSFPQLISILKRKYGLSEINVTENDIIDIYDTSLSGEKLVELLETPIEFCKYCSFPARNFDWKIVGNNSSLQDWLSEEV